MNADAGDNQSRNGRPPTRAMACEDIQALLYDYLTHEIGRARGELIREHIRKCTTCRTAAAEMQDSINLLKGGAPMDPPEPLTLSDDRRKRVWRAFMHPVLDWLYSHHIIASIVIAIVAVIVALMIVRHVKIIWNVREDDTPDTGLHPTNLLDIASTNTPDGQGWYMIRGEDGQIWFYHPQVGTNATTNGTVAQPDEQPASRD